MSNCRGLAGDAIELPAVGLRHFDETRDRSIRLAVVVLMKPTLLLAIVSILVAMQNVIQLQNIAA